LAGIRVRVPAPRLHAVGDNVEPFILTEVTAARHVALSGYVILNELSTVTPLAAVSVGGFGALILKVFEVAEVNPLPEKVMLAPDTGPRADADNEVKLIGLEPETMLLDAVHAAPPVPATAVAVTVADPTAVLPN
jgi:hypothetical protein